MSVHPVVTGCSNGNGTAVIMNRIGGLMAGLASVFFWDYGNKKALFEG